MNIEGKALTESQKRRLQALKRDLFADYMMGDPFDGDFSEDYSKTLEALTPEELEYYRSLASPSERNNE